MRTHVSLWWVLTAFFFIVGIIYTTWNIVGHTGDIVTRIEWVGTVVLFFTSFMAALIAFFVHRVHRAQGGELPEDVLTSEIDDGDPELGEFSPWSWWPLVLAFAGGVTILGLAVGWFMFPIGAAILVVALVGWVYEYYRGYFAH